MINTVLTKNCLPFSICSCNKISDDQAYKHHLTSVLQASYEIWEKSGRQAAPNGALMRTSVLGCFQFGELDKVKENTLQMCKVTHADPRFSIV